MSIPTIIKDTITKITEENNLNTSFCLAVAKVESNFYAFDESGYPLIRFEKHVFVRYCKKEGFPLLEKAIALEGHDYNTYLKAREIDTTKAILSSSFGLYQIMGFNHKLVGYDTPELFEEAMKNSVDNQVKAFVSFVKANKLVDAINNVDYEIFSRYYNGPEYAKYKYDIKLQNAYDAIIKAGV